MVCIVSTVHFLLHVMSRVEGRGDHFGFPAFLRRSTDEGGTAVYDSRVLGVGLDVESACPLHDERMSLV